MSNKTCGECRYYVSELKRCNMRKIICNIQPTDTGCSCFERKPIPKPTNGDVIRQMSNEELAELLTNPPCFVCSKGDAAGECTDTWRKKDCKSAILERLNAPAESEGE